MFALACSYALHTYAEGEGGSASIRKVVGFEVRAGADPKFCLRPRQPARQTLTAASTAGARHRQGLGSRV